MTVLAALTWALWAACWQAALVGALFAAVRLGLRRPQERYAAALLTLSVQLAWPVVTFARLLGVSTAQVNPAAPRAWWAAVAAAWAVGALVMLVRLAGGLWVVRRWAARAAPLSEALVARLETVREALGVRAVQYGALPELDVPITVGFWRPVVLVPVALLTSVPLEVLELLVAHELVHVRRWDAWVNALQVVVESLLFFHPVVWWVSRCARDEREFCVDDAVVQHQGGHARPYAEALLRLESLKPNPTLAVASTGGSFVNRIQRLFHPQSTRRAWPAVALALALVMGTAAAAFAYQERTHRAPTFPISAELAAGLCPAIKADACQVAAATGGTIDPGDAMTIVLADFGEHHPAFEAFLGSMKDVPPASRSQSIHASLSQALGSEWNCPEFDTMWDMKPVTWCQ